MIHRGNRALSGDFDFHRKRKPTVPMYADGLRLLGFGAFLTVWARVKKHFFDMLRLSRQNAEACRSFRGKRHLTGAKNGSIMKEIVKKTFCLRTYFRHIRAL